MKLHLNKQKLWLPLRLVLVGGLIVWLISRLDLPPLLVALQQINLRILCLIPLIWLVAFGLASLRWKLLLDRLTSGVSLTTIALLNLVGAFYSSFIPANVSGDVIKGLYLSRAQIGRVDAISSALADRLLGLAVTVWVGLLALLLTPEIRQAAGISQAAAFALLGVSLIVPLIGLVLLPRLGWLRERLPKALQSIYDVGVIYARHPRTLVISGVTSVGYFMGWVVILWMIAQAVQIDGVSIVSMAFVLAIVNLAQAIPISINGLGVREGAMLVLLPLYGVSNEKAVIFSLLIAILGWCTALAGGLLVIADVKILRTKAASN